MKECFVVQAFVTYSEQRQGPVTDEGMTLVKRGYWEDVSRHSTIEQAEAEIGNSLLVWINYPEASTMVYQQACLDYDSSYAGFCFDYFRIRKTAALDEPPN